MRLQLPRPFAVEEMLKVVGSSSFGTPYAFDGPTRLRRLVRVDGQTIALDFNFDQLSHAVEVNGALSDAALASLTAHLWGLQDDLAACHAALGGDPLLGPLIERFAGLRLIRAASLYEALLSAILGQQISVAAAQTLRRRLMTGLGEQRLVEGVALADYPAPERLLQAGLDGLQAVGVTRQRAGFLLAVAEAAAVGALEPARFADVDDAEAVAQLCAIPGVGRWTAEVALVYGLGRLDLLFAGDLALRGALQRLLGLPERPSEREVRRLGERWAGWRSYAGLYLLMTLKADRVK